MFVEALDPNIWLQMEKFCLVAVSDYCSTYSLVQHDLYMCMIFSWIYYDSLYLVENSEFALTVDGDFAVVVIITKWKKLSLNQMKCLGRYQKE